MWSQKSEFYLTLVRACLVTWAEHSEGLWGSSDIFLDLGGGYMAWLTQWKLIELCTFNLFCFVFFKSLSRFQLFVTPWTIAYQAPPSMGFSRQEYWSELPFPSQGDLPNPEIEPRSPSLQADALPSEPPGFNLYTCSYNLFT